MPLFADFGSKRVTYAGDSAERWFVCLPDERTFLALSRSGEVLDRRTLPAAIDRVVDAGGMLVAVAGGREGYDLTLCQRIWRFDQECRGFSRELGIARDRAFDIRTGAKLWSIDAESATVAFDDAFVFSLSAGDLVARERANGREAWRRTVGDAMPVLAVASGRVSFVKSGSSGQTIVSHLDARTGDPLAEQDLRGEVRGLVPTSKGLGLVFESGLDVLLGHGTVEPVIESAALDCVVTDGDAVAVLTDSRQMLVWMPSFDREPARRLSLSDPWEELKVGGGFLTLTSPDRTKLLRFAIDEPPSAGATPVLPLGAGDDFEPAEVVFAGPGIVLASHPTRGRFTLYASNTGLAKGATVHLGGFVPGPGNIQFATKLQYLRGGERVTVTVEPHTARRTVTIGSVPYHGNAQRGARPRAKTKKKAAAAPTPVRRLIDGLVADGLMDAPTDSALRKLIRRVFPDGAVGRDGKALLLHYVHGLTGGLSRGFLAHDRRFRTETDDVVAELAVALTGEPVTFEQIAQRDDALHVRSTVGGRSEEAWVKADGLAPLVKYMNTKLEAAGARKRIQTLETGEDWQAFVVR